MPLAFPAPGTPAPADSLPLVSIVVVNYNTPDEVTGCLDALRALDYPNVEILVVDNAGREGKRVAISDTDAATRVLTPETNLGFAGGANLGWTAARGALLAVVNPDVRVRPEWLRAITNGLTRHEARRPGILGSRLLYPDGRVQHAGGTFGFPAGEARLRGRGEPDGPAYAVDQEVPYVTGGALVLTRAAYGALGGFDTGYWPAYFEDADLCTRAWDAGFSVWYIADAVAFHEESVSLAHGGAAYFRAYQRNRLRYILRHYPQDRVLTEFAPMEEARLRGEIAPHDRVSSLNLYGSAAALRSAAARTHGAPVLPDADAGPAATRHDALQGMVAEVIGQWKVVPRPFTSRVPGLAWLRTRLNNLWTRWYVDPILAQQVAYNAALARTVRELADQVSGLEAALLVRAGLHETIIAGDGETPGGATTAEATATD